MCRAAWWPAQVQAGVLVLVLLARVRVRPGARVLVLRVQERGLALALRVQAQVLRVPERLPRGRVPRRSARFGSESLESA